MAEGPWSRTVLFVCLGNTCRSPMSEAVFKELLKKKGVADQWRVNSAAIADWQVGRPVDRRAQEMLHGGGITNFSHTATQITQEDFKNHKYILGMDDYNLYCLQNLKPADCRAHIDLLGSFDPKGAANIEDPFIINTMEAFRKAYAQICRSCEALFSHINNSH